QGTPTELKDSIGGSSLHVSLADQTAEGAARQLISHNFGPEAIHAFGQGQLTLAMQQANDAATVLLALCDGHVAGPSLAVHEPSLDDGFLAITGKAPAVDSATTKEVSA